MNGKKTPQIMGSGIIKNKKLIGFLDGEETKALLFIRNQVQGGILIEGVEENTLDTPVTFEIFKSKTNVKPVIQNNNNITIKLDIKATAAIDEVDGPEDIINEEVHTKLEMVAERKLNKQVEALIKKVQTEYGADIFGFAAKIYENKPSVWKKVGENWETNFKDLKVAVTSNVHIKNSAILSKTIKEGD
jgi:spore germination protein KC